MKKVINKIGAIVKKGLIWFADLDSMQQKVVAGSGVFLLIWFLVGLCYLMGGWIVWVLMLSIAAACIAGIAVGD